jgi:hypothetical protein
MWHLSSVILSASRDPSPRRDVSHFKDLQRNPPQNLEKETLSVK